jgi:hypothetical protein
MFAELTIRNTTQKVLVNLNAVTQIYDDGDSTSSLDCIKSSDQTQHFPLEESFANLVHLLPNFAVFHEIDINRAIGFHKDAILYVDTNAQGQTEIYTGSTNNLTILAETIEQVYAILNQELLVGV